jgi:hypothetical protein
MADGMMAGWYRVAAVAKAEYRWERRALVGAAAGRGAYRSGGDAGNEADPSRIERRRRVVTGGVSFTAGMKIGVGF